MDTSDPKLTILPPSLGVPAERKASTTPTAPEPSRTEADQVTLSDAAKEVRDQSQVYDARAQSEVQRSEEVTPLTELEEEAIREAVPTEANRGRAINAYQAFAEPRDLPTAMENAARGTSTERDQVVRNVPAPPDDIRSAPRNDVPERDVVKENEQTHRSTPSTATQQMASVAVAAHAAEVRLDVDLNDSRMESPDEDPYIQEVERVKAGEES